MKDIGRFFAVMAASMTVAAGAFVSPASAAPQPPAFLGDVSEWGMVEIKVDDTSSEITPFTTEDVGGGTWTYGTVLNSDGKLCYSYYFHASVSHKSTAKIQNRSTTATNSPGYTSFAERQGGGAYTCYAYWGKL
ncbi:lactococcin 972 family bacteriocin [Streptomyces sp. NPDC086077]|uniref:lactococcin 972 family bacteriocin n=1 Tax=Streptomyces sp. NPDC086077 TaxID=3154862 RepID=UPI003439B563